MVRGANLTFVLLGFVLFFMHIRAVAAPSGSPSRAMMNHRRLSPFLLICAKAVGSAYKNVLALLVMPAVKYLLRGVWEMEERRPVRRVLLLRLAGRHGPGRGHGPEPLCQLGPIVQTAYARVMFLTSGKFFVDALPDRFRQLMDLNPLSTCWIDAATRPSSNTRPGRPRLSTRPWSSWRRWCWRCWSRTGCA